MAPKLVPAFIDEFKAEFHRLAGDAEAERDAAHCALAKANRKIAGILQAIEDGAYHPTLKERLTFLEKEKEAAAARLAVSQSKPVLQLHSNLSALYQSKVQRLAAALNEPGTAAKAGEIIRGLIDRIVLTSSGGILKAELYGDLAAIMGYAEGELRPDAGAPGSAEPGTLFSVVAGVGFEPTTFRL